jgi:uridine phosphorylase
VPKFRRAVLVFHSATRSRFAMRRFGGSPLGYKLLTGATMEEVLLCPDGQTVLVVNVGSHGGGGPLATSLVEELAFLGVKVIVGLGCAGSLDPSLPRGTQFVAARGLATDGASRVYLSRGQDTVSLPERELAVVTQAADGLGIPVVPTTGVTVDVIYRETPELVAQWRGLGGHWINMEVTPLYAAAAACGVRAIYLGHISDELFGPEWRAWFGDERNAMAETTAELGAAILEQMLRT